MSKTLDNNFYTTEILSENQELTPEGFLLCKNVAVGRTGEQVYLEAEIGLEGLNGVVIVNRTDDHVFRPKTMASYEGKCVTLQHPYDIDGVTPRNYNTLSKGTMLNLRRGNDSESDLLLADLLIMDQEAIHAVTSKRLVEVSCGYDCDYVQDSPGHAHQENIVGNHVALVERGRAGKRCSIKDHDGGWPMATTKKSLAARLYRSFFTKDEKAFDEAMNEITEDDYESSNGNENNKGEDNPRKSNDAITKSLDALQKSLDSMSERLDKIEGKDSELENKKTDDEDLDPEDMTADTILEAEKVGKFDNGKSYMTGDSITDTLARAEMLVPGFKSQTKDSVITYGNLLKLRIKVLDAAMQTEFGKSCVSPFVAHGKKFETMKAGELNLVYIAASEIARGRNNSSGSGKSPTRDSTTKPTSIAEINARNAEHWNKSKGNK